MIYLGWRAGGWGSYMNFKSMLISDIIVSEFYQHNQADTIFSEH